MYDANPFATPTAPAFAPAGFPAGQPVHQSGQLGDQSSMTQSDLAAIRHVGVAALAVVVGISAVGAGISAYHGYHRNCGSVGSAVAWGAGGFFLPVILPIVAVAQGYGEAHNCRP